MSASITKYLKRSILLKKSIRLITRHPDKDVYDGVVLALNKEIAFLLGDRDFIIDGINVFPIRSIRKIRMGQLEAVRDKIFYKYKLIKRARNRSWLLKSKNLQQIFQKCKERRIWPVVETKKGKASALYIGPVTKVGNRDFCIFTYDAKGNWEKNYRLLYKDVFRIELFDSYSKYFNRYMRDGLKSRKKPF